MRTVAFFNNKGGVGKTTLCFHLSHMFERLGLRVLTVDLDPQANLTAAFMDFEAIEELWRESGRPVDIAKCLAPLSEIEPRPLPTAELWPITNDLALLPGNLNLSRFEDSLSNAWLQIESQDPGAHIRTTIAFWTVMRKAALEYKPDVILVDVGPNLGAITRATLIATDMIIVPLGADVFSIQGLQNLGPTLRDWRERWRGIVKRQEQAAGALPPGFMEPVGYIVLQHAVRKNRPVKAYQRWFERIPETYSHSVLDENGAAPALPSDDPHCLGQIKHYQSLVPLSQDTHKPMFDLTAGDGAIGGHQNYVKACYADFEELARRVIEQCGLEASSKPHAAAEHAVLPFGS